jgi:pimeloyl-ACP methyl ester carboxylesterase
MPVHIADLRLTINPQKVTMSHFGIIAGALNDTWKWLEKDLTLITIPWAGHFVQQDAAEFVTKNMVRWLSQ